MKALLIFFTLFLQIQVFANMANPVIEGTLGGSPFVNKYVDVIHEDLFIKPDKSFQYATFNVKYHIDASRDGVKIPFLFYASEYSGSFTVTVDGTPIPIQDIPYGLKKHENRKFKDFSYFF